MIPGSSCRHVEEDMKKRRRRRRRTSVYGQAFSFVLL